MEPVSPNLCLVCRSALKHPRENRGIDAGFYDCPRCGKYGLRGSAEAILPPRLKDNRTKIATFSHYLRRMQESQEWPLVSADLAERILEEGRLPSPSQQADNFIRLVAHTSRGPGEQATLLPDSGGAIIGAKSTEGFVYIAQSLLSSKLISGGVQVGGAASVFLTLEGWRRLEELERAVPDSRTAFMAMKFGRPETDRLFREFLKPAVALTGFDLRRLDEKPKAGLIDQRMEVDLRTARFIVADLTYGNRGAYWEAGFARGLGKPVFYLCEANRFRRVGTHFDTNHHYTILWNGGDLQKAADELKTAIRATLPADSKLVDD